MTGACCSLLTYNVCSVDTWKINLYTAEIFRVLKSEAGKAIFALYVICS